MNAISLELSRRAWSSIHSSMCLKASLLLSLNHLQTPNASIYLFPEGEIVPVHSGPLEFKRGLTWLRNQANTTDIVPIAIYVDYSKSSKPNLHIHIGSVLKADENPAAHLEKKSANYYELIK